MVYKRSEKEEDLFFKADKGRMTQVINSIITVFSKFLTKSYRGTGLGLFIATSTMEAYDGRIWADNNDCGK